MTSTANPQNPTQAPNPAAPSYASAASAPKKPGTGPNTIVASGSNPPAVVASSAPPKTASVSPANGRPSIPPALPVVQGSSSANGGAGDHARKPSVTISANGPQSYGANGGPVGNSKSSIQFGFKDSPGVTHSSPQTGGASPIPIPGSGTVRVASPAQSPSPIPQPTASGGRPPSGLQQTGDVKPSFGSFNNDPERHIRQSAPHNNFQNQSFHTRQGSNISMASTGDMGNQGMPGPNRGGFHHGGGRGRGGFNPNNPPYNPHNPATGYPPQSNFRNGHGQGRNSMPPSFQPQAPPSRGYANSPQPNRGSPALVPSNPNTPSMPPAMPAPGTPQFYQPPMAAQQQNMAGYAYPPPAMNPYPGQMPPNPYNYPMHYPGQAGSPAYAPYGGPPYQPTGPAAMARTPSASEKPNYGPGAPNQPVVVSTPQMSHAQPKPAVVAGNSLPRPAKKAIVIKRPDGGIVDVGNIKPSSPAPSRTPPVVSSTATPPTKPSTPAHTRSESQAPPKTREEIQEELRAKIAQATGQASSASEDAKNDEAAKAAAAAEKEKAEAAEKAKVEAEEKAKAEAEEKARKEAEVKAQQEAEAKAKKEAEEEASKKAAPAALSDDPTEEELERMIQEMEEADRKREEEEDRRREEAAAKKAAAKALADQQAPENDRKLREAEREMERLEEEKERKARERGNAEGGLSVAELLKGRKEPESPKVDSVTEKLAGISLDSKPSTPTSATGAKTPLEKSQRKPAALNLSISTKPVEPPQPSAALQSLKTSRFLTIKEASDPSIYAGSALASPNPATNAAVNKKGQSFKYDAAFLLQFQNVFTEQPSTEFQSQVKNLIGDADGNRSASRTPSTRQGPSRTPSGFPGQIGAFQNPRSMPPPGGAPADRMGMPSGAVPRSSMGALQFSQSSGRSFPGSPLIGGRQPSSGGRHDSSRQGSRQTGRSGSHRPAGGYNNQAAQQAAKTMPLTQGQELKPIAVTASGWKPTSIGGKVAQPAPGGHMEPEMVQRKVKAALNKMTPENFDRISDQILTIANQSKNENDGRTLRQVIQLTFEKATDESHFAGTYAKFCKRMLDQMSNDIKDDAIKDKHGSVVSGGNLFRKYLLNRCQEEFEKGWSVSESEEKTENKAPGGAALLTDEYYKEAAVKRRGLGLVRFIGELFKLGMLTERIIHGCVHQLVDYKGQPKEAEIESLCYLLRTVGAQLDSSDKGRPMMDAYFQRIQNMIDIPELENRLKFMLMDVRDMRKDAWKAAEVNKGPKTLDEVRAEAEQVAAAKAAENARAQGGRGGGGRPQLGRGDARAFSAGGYSQVNNTVGMDDLKRLKSNSRVPAGGVTLGPHSMLASRSNSGRRPGGPGGSFGRSGDNSGMSSRTGTPPTRESANAFGLLATMDSENAVSPPTTGGSPALSKATPASDAAETEKKA
ncbi:related to translation initiation factor eIF-4F [Cephalotrichum gorgonifer]|uniref:Related to translation initiation factor eIF-4F n=1 Tax=Cephalotrichum gorgonifer TaxID=2041049 RepID=A0AAE8MUL2_9PEZI|nr:related to translation initiation factor eIF-4F [Cephalotrichum gorgonifer]